MLTSKKMGRACVFSCCFLSQRDVQAKNSIFGFIQNITFPEVSHSQKCCVGFFSLFLSFCYVDTKNRMGKKIITTEIITSVCASGHSCVFVWLWLRLEYVFTKLQQLL